MIPIADILSRLKSVKQAGRGYAALCPAHDDRNPSLSISEGDDGRILVHCHHGCTAEEIVAALGLEMRDLMPDTQPAQRAKKPVSKVVATYDYTDADGTLIYQVVRMEPKDFRQRRPHPDGKNWIWGISKGKYYQGKTGDWRPCPRDYEGEYVTFPAVPPTIYHLPRIVKAAAKNSPIVIVEGEKDADALIRLGIIATCNTGGAGKFHLIPPEVIERFRGMRVAIMPDSDVPGRKHAEQILSILGPIVSEMRITTVPDPHKDISDWIAAGATREDISKLLSDTPKIEPAPSVAATTTATTASTIEADFMSSPAAPFRCVGFVRDENFYYSRGKKCVLSFRAREHTPIAMQHLASMPWWESHFMGRQGVDWDAARNALFRVTERTGPYDARRVRGCGAWYDEGRIVLHRGDHLVVDGAKTELNDFPSRYIYEATWASGDNGAEPLPADDARHLLDLSDLLSWRQRVNARLFAGWCFIAPVCGALAWRPHIWVTGASGTGKAQPHSVNILTPTGWKTMGELRVGDYVTTPDNGFGKIRAVYPQGTVPIYKVTFADGRQTRATGDHLWKVRLNGDWRIRTTMDMIDIIKTKAQQSRHLAIPLSQSIAISGNNKTSLPVDPYLLGVFLGDGHLANIGKRKAGEIRVTTYDDFIAEKIKTVTPKGMTFFPTNHFHSYRFGDLSRYGRTARKLIKDLRLLGSRSHNKFIPPEYLGSKIDDRIALLQGLMDTDGTAGKYGGVSFSTSSPQLAQDITYLVRSLGGIAKTSTKQPYYTHKGEKKQGRIAYIINIRLTDPCMAFSLPRKKERVSSYQYSDCLYLNVTSIESDGNEEASCILIDHPDHLYITDDFIVTHNSWTIQHILKPVLGRGTLEAQSSTTEAGIRQAIGTNAFPVLLDEAEGEDQRAQTRIQAIIELARQASSESGAPILKGTARGAAMTFIIRSCFAFSSIGVAAVQKADLSRISILELAKPHPKDAQDRFDEICEAALVLTPEWCERLRARAVTSIPRILENSRIFARAAAEYFRDTRIGDQIGALLAGSYALANDDTISPVAAARLIDEQDWEEQSVVEAEKDEIQCLSTILQRMIQIGQDGRRYDRNIGDLINFVVADMQGSAPTDHDLKDREAKDTLLRFGIKIMDENNNIRVCISDSNVELKKLLGDTPWTANWRHQLRRIDGAESKNTVRFGPYYVSRATIIPVTTLTETGKMSAE